MFRMTLHARFTTLYPHRFSPTCMYCKPPLASSKEHGARSRKERIAFNKQTLPVREIHADPPSTRLPTHLAQVGEGVEVLVVAVAAAVAAHREWECRLGCGLA